MSMTRSDKVGKALWIAYLVAASPAAILLLGASSALVWQFYDEPVGPLEVPEPSIFDQVTGYGAFFGFPFMWLMGVFMAHRFEDPKRRYIPFLANLLPALLLFRLSILLHQDGEASFGWVVAYTGLLSLILLLGTCVVLASRENGSQTVGLPR